MQTFSVDQLPSDPETWPRFRKTALAKVLDGYLAVDARGFPYPIDAAEFDMIYAPAD